MNEDKITVVTRDRMKKWARTPGPDEIGGDDDLQGGEEEVDVVGVPVPPGGVDEEEDHRGDGCAHLPIMADQATPPQADRDQPGEDHEAEPEGVEQEHAPARLGDRLEDKDEDVEECYPDLIDEPASELDQRAMPRPTWDEVLSLGEGGGDTASSALELYMPETTTTEPAAVGRPHDEQYEPHLAGEREPDPLLTPHGPVQMLELEGLPVTRRQLGVNEEYTLMPTTA